MAHIVTPLDLPSSYKDHQSRNVCDLLYCAKLDHMNMQPCSQVNTQEILAKSSTLYVRE